MENRQELAYQVLDGANEGGAQAALVQVFSVAQVSDLVDQLREQSDTVRVCRQTGSQQEAALTFPLTSCSTMFSGFRSLWMILFSWRYWIPDPAAESS